MVTKGNRLFIISAGSVIILLIAAYAFFAAHNREQEEKPLLPPLGSQETDAAVWGQYYPRHYDSYHTNYEIAPTTYGGSEKYSKLEREPYLKKLFAGYGFAEEYNEDRGHVYTLEDIRAVNPARKKSGAVCLSCKTAEVPSLLDKYGDAFYPQTFEEIDREVSHPITCLDCHDPVTMDLKITRPALIEAFERQGKDIAKASRQEMRTLVCAQCHVEYYFIPDSKKLTFPWDNGFKPDETEAYYDKLNFSDWTHPESGTKLLKAQHPDYEFFLGGPHQAAGLACADCHMPYIKEGNVKISSHWWTSPLKHLEQSCTVCHRESAKYLEQRVLATQEKNYELLTLAGNTIAQAIEAIQQAAATPGVDAGKLEEARQSHRQAQWRWDWMSAENSMGFHNPQEGLNILGKAIDYAHRAIETAQRAQARATGSKAQ